MFAVASLVLSTALVCAPLSESAALESPFRHVRTQDRSVRYLLKRGFTHSPTFAHLMACLDHSDVLVYVEEVARLPGALAGRMLMAPAGHGQRYVRIEIALRGTPDESIALLGHELQHAIEVAQEIAVDDEAALRALYQRIGVRGGDGGDHVYETLAAQQVGRTVRKELLG
jgi:hypothetical protein